MKLDDCNALITGASAGIGREFARQLAGCARSMILVARRDERLIELADQLQREHPKLLVHIRKVDLADLGQLQAFLERLDRDGVTRRIGDRRILANQSMTTGSGALD